MLIVKKLTVKDIQKYFYSNVTFTSALWEKKILFRNRLEKDLSDE